MNRRQGFLQRHRFGLAIALAAILLRTHRITEVFASSDAADLAYSVVKHVCGSSSVSDALSDFTLFRLGGVQPVVIYLHALVTQFFGFTLDAPAWNATTMVVSGLSVFVAYLLGVELAGKSAGIWCAILLAVSPIHIMLGRHLGAPWAYEILFQILILLLFIKQVRTPSTKYVSALCVSLALYVWCGNQMAAIFPILGLGLFAGYFESERGGFLSYLRLRFLSWWWLVPCVSMLWLVWVTWEYREGHLAHALFDKRKEPGWYLLNWFKDLFRDIGHGPTWIGLSALLLGLTTGRRLLSLKALPFVYFFCYAVPFWVWISRRTTLTTGYVVYSITALLLITAIVPFLTLSPKRVRHVIPMFSALLLLLGTFGSVFKQMGTKGYLGVRGFQGAYKPNIGATAAAAFIREHSGNAKAGVFSDAFGGGGLEPPIMRLYFRRPTYSVYDARSPHVPYQKFKNKRDKIQYLVVSPKHTSLPRKYFGDAFQSIAEIVTDEGDTLLHVFAKEAQDSTTKISVTEGDRLYRTLYPKLCSR